MKNLYIYCEGYTEESFINKVLYPYLMNVGVCARPIICTTKRTKSKKFCGGASDYQKIRKELNIICKKHKNEAITTMFDYYGLPGNTPGIEAARGGLYEKVDKIEEAVNADINMPNLFFNLIVHEFEGLLFANPAVFATVAGQQITAELQSMRDAFESPEHINNSLDTAPSKRIKKCIPTYAKVMDGTSLSGLIGIDTMMAECRHFREWMAKIRALAG